MTTSDIEIGDIGMLSYRLPVAPRSTQTMNNQQQQMTRRSVSCLDKADSLTTPIKWELTSRTKVLINDPLGLLNPTPPAMAPPLVAKRTTSVIVRPFANSTTTAISSSSEVKPVINPSPKEDEVSSLFPIPTSITQLRAKFNQSGGLSALYNPKNLNTIKSFALDRLSEFKTSVKSTTIPLTQSKSLYAVKNLTPNKERTLIKDPNNKLRGSMSSLISQQSSNSSSLNTNNINGMDIQNIHDDIKALRLDPSTVAIPIPSNDDNGHSPSRIIEISSCNRCSSCNQFLYDEEIMNGWSPDDSELHTTCAYCEEKTIPNLNIYIRVRNNNRANNKINRHFSRDHRI